MPFTNTPLARVDAFIPAFQTAILFTDLITSALLFAQYSVVRSRALLVLASGFLFTALIIIPHTLSFPGVFAPKGLLSDGPQTTAMLYYFWHTGSPLAVIFYVCLKDTDIEPGKSRRSVASVIGLSVAVVVAIVCGLTLIAAKGGQALPTIFHDSVRMNMVPHMVGGLMLAIWTTIAFVLLYLRRRTVLDLWLLVMCFAWLVEVTINAFLAARFNLGWYVSRLIDLASAGFFVSRVVRWTTRADPLRCPLWVKSRHSPMSKPCPLYPQKRTLIGITSMSGLCQKATFAVQNVMSALPPIATAKADSRKRPCPLYPQKQTCAVHKAMSA